MLPFRGRRAGRDASSLTTRRRRRNVGSRRETRGRPPETRPKPNAVRADARLHAAHGLSRPFLESPLTETQRHEIGWLPSDVAGWGSSPCARHGRGTSDSPSDTRQLPGRLASPHPHGQRDDSRIVLAPHLDRVAPSEGRPAAPASLTCGGGTPFPPHPSRRDPLAGDAASSPSLWGLIPTRKEHRWLVYRPASERPP